MSSLTKYGLLLFLLIIMVVTGLFGGHFGYTVDGVPQGGVVYEEPEIEGWLSWLEPMIGVIKWVWDSGTFLFNMVSFQVDGMPVVISSIYLVMSLMVMFIILNLVRGTS